MGFYCGELERYNEEEKKREMQKEKSLRILSNMNDDELDALEEFIHKIGKEHRKRNIQKQIKDLKEELGEE